MSTPRALPRRFWIRHERYPYLLAKLVFFGLIAWIVYQALHEVERVLVPILVSMLLAYLFDPAVDWFEDRGWSRTSGMLLLIAGAGVGVAAFIFFVYPTIALIIEEIVAGVPQLLTLTETDLLPWIETTFSVTPPHSVRELLTDVGARAQDNVPALLGGAVNTIAEAWTRTGAIVSSLLNLVLVPVLTFYFLRDFDLMKERIGHYLPIHRRSWLITRFTEMDQVAGAWIRGQIEVAMILGLMYAFGLGITFGLGGQGIGNGISVGFVGGLLNIVPYFGFIVGFAMAVLIVLLDWSGWGPIIGVLLTFAISQTLEGYVVTPRIVGEKVGMSPVMVIIALLFGAELLGLVGVLLAIPVVGSLRVFLPDLVAWYRGSDLYLGVGDELDQLTDDDEPTPSTEASPQPHPS